MDDSDFDGDLDCDSNDDDGDGDIDEDPNGWDTDGDGMPDGWEAANGLDPTSSSNQDGTFGEPVVLLLHPIQKPMNLFYEED